MKPVKLLKAVSKKYSKESVLPSDLINELGNVFKLLND